MVKHNRNKKFRPLNHSMRNQISKINLNQASSNLPCSNHDYKCFITSGHWPLGQSLECGRFSNLLDFHKYNA